ncbi:hypothetical protein JTB14_035435 [Gonioctena quinquepunctata]|nr:hypothetical protein JTB14_035435 [Gonioctena quinquepunctata]
MCNLREIESLEHVLLACAIYKEIRENDFFRCCQECAKTEGEPCGGDLGFSGTCEPGLTCQQPGPSPSEGLCRPIIFDNHEDT